MKLIFKIKKVKEMWRRKDIRVSYPRFMVNN